MTTLAQLSAELRAAVEQGDFDAAEKLLARQREALTPPPRSDDLLSLVRQLTQLRLLTMARRANDLATLAGIRKPIVYPAADPQPSQSWRFDG